MPRPHQVAPGVLPRAQQIPRRLLRHAWHPYRGQLPDAQQLLPATESEHERDAADERVRVVESGLGSHVAAAALALSASPYRLTQSGQSAAVMPSG